MATAKQIAALKYMILMSRNAKENSKKILVFLINKSKRMTKEVCISLVADREGYSANEIESVGHELGGMNSSSGTTHFHELLVLMGSELNFSLHYGDFDPKRSGDLFNNAGQFPGFDKSKVTNPELTRKDMPMRYTFWLAKKNYSRKAELVTATRKEIERIDLRKPGLYKSIELVE